MKPDPAFDYIMFDPNPAIDFVIRVALAVLLGGSLLGGWGLGQWLALAASRRVVASWRTVRSRLASRGPARS